MCWPLAGVRRHPLRRPKDNERIHLIIVLLADEVARITCRCSLRWPGCEGARICQRADSAPDLDLLYDRLLTGLAALPPGRRSCSRIESTASCSASEHVAKAAGVRRSWCSATRLSVGLKPKVVRIHENDPCDAQPRRRQRGTKRLAEIIQVRSFSSQRLAQLRSAVLVALTRGLISFNDRLCCVAASRAATSLIRLVVVDVERAVPDPAHRRATSAADVKPEVLERVLRWHGLGSRGPEGRPVVACLSWRHQKVEKLIKPLVLNPFYGYKRRTETSSARSWMKHQEFSPSTGVHHPGDGVVESRAASSRPPTTIMPCRAASAHAMRRPRRSRGHAVHFDRDLIDTGQVALFRRGVMLR